MLDNFFFSLNAGAAMVCSKLILNNALFTCLGCSDKQYVFLFKKKCIILILHFPNPFTATMSTLLSLQLTGS